MLKKLITYFFLLTWLCQLSGRYVVMLEFYINQQYIASTLCENRDKPKMHCNGKCHLRKQLSAEEKRNQENPERRAENKSEVFHAGDYAQITLKPAVRLYLRSYNIITTIGCPVDRPTSIFHPPAVA